MKQAGQWQEILRSAKALGTNLLIQQNVSIPIAKRERAAAEK